MKSTSKVLTSALATVTLALFLAGNRAMAAQDPNTQIVSPNGQYQGQSYDDAERLWWQTMFSTPISGGLHPLLQGGAIMDTATGTLLLAPDPTGSATTISVTVPRQTSIFVPAINTECDSITGSSDETAQLNCASNQLASAAGVSATINGTAVTSILQYSNTTPQFVFTLPQPPSSNVFNSTNTTGTAVAAAVSLHIKPGAFSTGTNTIVVQGTIPGVRSYNTTFILNVQP